MPQIMAFREGLNILRFLEMIKEHPDLCRELFVWRKSPLTVDYFLSNMLSKASQHSLVDPVKKQAHTWFLNYIRQIGDERYSDFPEGRLPVLLKFTTGFSRVPRLLPFRIDIKYLADDENKTMPEAAACVGLMSLPTVHSTDSEFYKNIDKALDYGSEGFGTF